MVARLKAETTMAIFQPITTPLLDRSVIVAPSLLRTGLLDYPRFPLKGDMKADMEVDLMREFAI